MPGINVRCFYYCVPLCVPGDSLAKVYCREFAKKLCLTHRTTQPALIKGSIASRFQKCAFSTLANNIAFSKMHTGITFDLK